MLPSHPEVTGNRRAVLARLESPRHRLCDTRALARGTRAVRQRQLPTNPLSCGIQSAYISVWGDTLALDRSVDAVRGRARLRPARPVRRGGSEA